jgi:hypothetical protein
VLLTLTWFISGARRGVGKTYLVEQLGAVLPDSVSAKNGRSRIGNGKPANFFSDEEELRTFLKKCWRKYRHIVVEANTHYPVTRNGLTIFLDARPDGWNIRPDVGRLRRAADICIGNGETAEQWREVLEKRLDNTALVDTILDILIEQEQFSNGNNTKKPKEKR